MVDETLHLIVAGAECRFTRITVAVLTAHHTASQLERRALRCGRLRRRQRDSGAIRVSVFTPCNHIAIEHITVDIAVVTGDTDGRTELPCTDRPDIIRRRQVVYHTVIDVGDVAGLVACDPTAAIRFDAAFVETPRVRVDPRPYTCLFMHTTNEGVDPFDRLIEDQVAAFVVDAFPVENGDTSREIVFSLADKIIGFCGGVVIACVMVEPPRQTACDRLLHETIAIPIGEIDSLGRLHDDGIDTSGADGETCLPDVYELKGHITYLRSLSVLPSQSSPQGVHRRGCRRR